MLNSFSLSILYLFSSLIMSTCSFVHTSPLHSLLYILLNPSLSISACLSFDPSFTHSLSFNHFFTSYPLSSLLTPILPPTCPFSQWHSRWGVLPSCPPFISQRGKGRDHPSVSGAQVRAWEGGTLDPIHHAYTTPHTIYARTQRCIHMYMYI